MISMQFIYALAEVACLSKCLYSLELYMHGVIHILALVSVCYFRAQ